jgi:hypothetical protein
MKRLRVLGLVLVSLGSTTAALIWSLSMKGVLDAGRQKERAVRVDAVRELLDTQTVQTVWAARQIASVAAADPRPRAALSIEPFDQATLQDAVDEVQADTHLDWLGLCSNLGRVLVGAGPPALKAMVGAELRDTPLFQQTADEKGQSTLWFTANGPMVVTAAAVMKGSTRVGVVLVGRLLQGTIFERAASVAGGPVGLLGPHGEWAGSTSAPPDEVEVLRSGSRVWPGVSLVLKAPPPPLPGGLWLPLVIVAVMGIVSLLLLSSLRVPLAKN